MVVFFAFPLLGDRGVRERKSNARWSQGGRRKLGASLRGHHYLCKRAPSSSSSSSSSGRHLWRDKSLAGPEEEELDDAHLEFLEERGRGNDGLLVLIAKGDVTQSAEIILLSERSFGRR